MRRYALFVICYFCVLVGIVAPPSLLMLHTFDEPRPIDPRIIILASTLNTMASMMVFQNFLPYSVIKKLKSNTSTTKVTPLKQWDKEDEKCVFYETLRWTLIAGRIFGLVPIQGLLQNNSQLTGYTAKSIYTVYNMASLVSLSYHLWFVVFSLTKFTGFTADTMSVIDFVATNVIAVYMWLYLSKNWRNTITKIESLEKVLVPVKKRRALLLAVKMFLIAISIAGLTEHAVFTVYLYYIGKCKNQNNKNEDTSVSFSDTFLDWVGWVRFEIVKLQTVVVYNMTDILLITVSVYLIHRFHDFNTLLMQKQLEIRRNSASSIAWGKLQQLYTYLTQLVNAIDGMVQVYVLLSFALNMLRIGQHIFFILRKQLINVKSDPCNESVIGVIFLVYSVVLTIVRLLLVAFTAAHVHTLSQKPLELVHTLPSKAYDYDVQKLIDQVYHSKPCLTGLGFFYITRGMILTMAATLLTYEMMLIQYVETTVE